MAALLAAGVGRAADAGIPAGAKRILFLGDSITHAGGYVAAIETYFQLAARVPGREFLNLGLPSETVSGLSEDGHAGGRFPRPDLHERLVRVLERTKPDLVFACYGMNDGIYLPPAEERFAAYRRGIGRLRAAVEAAGAKIVHVTPPPFDETRGKHPGYDTVLRGYAVWLVERRKDGWQTIDLHTAMTAALAERRKAEPAFTFSPDAVHPGPEGHWRIAQAILAGLGETAAAGKASLAEFAAAYPNGGDVQAKVAERQALLKLAWLTATGHRRPGIKDGLPLAEAQARAAEIEAEIGRLTGR